VRRVILSLSVLATVGLAAAPASASMAVDWADHLSARVELPDGWVLEGCERMDPTLCAYDGEGSLAGTVILGVLEVWAHEDVSPQGMAAQVADFHEVFTQDRVDTCGPDFTYEPDELVQVTVGGQPGYRYGFSLYDGDGRLHEHAVIHLTFASGMRFVLNTNFIDPNGCPGADHERDEFAIAHIPVITPHLDQLAAESILPVNLTFGPSCEPGAVPAGGFVDVAGNVHEHSIDCIAWHGLTAGTAPGRYSPAAPVTREEFAADLKNNIDELTRLGVPRSVMSWWIPPYEWYNEEISRWSAEEGMRLFSFTPGTLSHADYTEESAPNYRSSETIYRSIFD
jgi:hypothetical protein